MGLVDLSKRRCEYYGDGVYSGDCAWYSYGRWILFAAIVVGFFLLFLLFSCITARRRRRMGQMPFYGTGWAAQGVPQYTNQQQYYNQQQPNQYNQGWNSQPPPQYGAQDNGYYSGQPKPDTTGQQNGVELQPPNQAYQPRGGDNVYTPPAGPPPGK